MYIEDILKNLAAIGGVNRFDKNVVESLNFQVNIMGSGFTEKQSLLALKILKRYLPRISAAVGHDLTSYVDNPLYRYPVRSSVPSVYRVSIVKNSQFNKCIKVEFPYDEALVQFIREQKSNLKGYHFALWDKEEKAWIFSLSEVNIGIVLEIMTKKNFSTDEEFDNLASQYHTIIKNVENYTPMLFIEDNMPKFKNLPPNLPYIENTGWIESLFTARKYGVTVWDDAIDTFLKSDNVNKLLYDFLTTDPSEIFKIDSGKFTLSDIGCIIKYLEPGLFCIPGGHEMEKIVECYTLLQSMEVKNEEISVLFRLPNETGKNFNEFVKNNHLNNPITEKTRFMIISTKLPKTVLASPVNVNSVISFSEHFSHHTLRDFVKNCQNFIHYNKSNDHKGISFANL